MTERQRRSQFDGGPLRPLWRRVGNPLDWDSTNRVLLLLSFNLVIQTGIIVVLEVYRFLPIAAYFNPAGLLFTRVLVWAVLGFWLVLLAATLRLRKLRRTSRVLEYAFTQSFTVYFCVLIYVSGIYTTPMWLVITAGIVIGNLLLDREVIDWGYYTGTVLLVTATVLERLEVIPYAPLFDRAPFREDGRIETPWLIVLAALAFVFLYSVWYVSREVIARWHRREGEFRRASIIDSLTGLANRRWFMEQLAFECRRARRLKHPLALLMCDADHFKQVNDTYGHRTGDEVLRRLAVCIEGQTRAGVDTAARIGGEEFAVLLVETDVSGARAVAERIVERVRSERFTDGRNLFEVTISVGAATVPMERLDPDALLEAADALLYRAKNRGRDRAVAEAFE